jgi:transposase
MMVLLSRPVNGRKFGLTEGLACQEARLPPSGRRDFVIVGGSLAIHFSLLASCKRHGHNPWLYYRDVLTRLPAMLPDASDEALLTLLPHRWQPA